MWDPAPDHRDGAASGYGTTGPDRAGSPEPGEMLVPDRWPSAWRHLWRPARDRAVFVGAVVGLTVVGVLFAGDLLAEWWIPLLPTVLLTGPVSRPGRVRRTLERAASRGRLRTMTGRLHPGPVTSRGPSVRLVTPSGHAVVLSTSRSVAYALAGQHVSERALLVWARSWTAGRYPAALVLGGTLVAYLRRVPRGAIPVVVPVRLTAAKSALVRT